jgi:hypothetical protein
MKTRPLTWIALASALTLATACTNKQGETEAPIFVTLDLPGQPLVISVTNPVPLQVPVITLHSHLKNPASPDTAHFADMQVQFYTVEFFRQDGGKLVPPTQTFGVAGLLVSGGDLTLNNFPILTGGAIQQTPFDQLLPFNGGIDRETGLNEIHMFYRLTFFGDTASGFRVQSETAVGDFIAQ